MPAGTAVQIHWTPLDAPVRLASQFDSLAIALSDAEAPMATIAQRMAMHTQERFTSQSSPEGASWAYWAESYAPFALAHNVGILQQGGDLEASASSPSSYLAMRNDVFINTAGWPYYWDWMNSGTSKAPPRPFVGMSADEEVEYSEIWMVWVEALSAEAMSSGGTMFMRHSARGIGGRWAPRSSFVL